ncbi:MAG: flagellar basal body rod protein FlgC [Bryobacterales bacterium]|jgi:flagellar basal-body rod protein FlgC|nr:flagellar basal body rod protein FlgC [Bryobacterales bacterium]
MSLLSAISVSASGMAAQRVRAELLVENMANAETTRTPEGGPYRRKDAVFASEPQGSPFAAVFQTEMAAYSTGVGVAEVVEDTREPVRRYLPGHPDADADGYVAFPNVSPAEDMVDLMAASRGYQVNVAAISAVKDMIQRSIDLLR